MTANLANALSPTRNRILQLLKERGKATASELSRLLNISRIAVYHHLHWLKANNLVKATVEHRKRGRPTEVFSLTEEAQERLFPRRYDLLALTLLDTVEEELGDKFLYKLFRRYRERLTQRLQGRDKNLRERVKELARLLSEEGYLAQWQETADGFLLSIPNCPIEQVARRFPCACATEEEFLTAVLDVPVVRYSHQPKGDACCLYFIAKPTKNKNSRKATARRSESR